MAQVLLSSETMRLAVQLLMASVVWLFMWLVYENVDAYCLRHTRNEASTTLESIIARQSNHRQSTGRYLSVGPRPPLPDDPRHRRVKRPFAAGGFEEIAFVAPGPVWFSYQCTTTEGLPSEVTCAAVGDADGDGDLAVLVMGTNNNSGAIVAPVPPIARGHGCAVGQTVAGEVVRCTEAY